MSQFLTELDGDFLNDKDFRLSAPLIYQSDVAQRTIEVPAGFVTDFASFRIGMLQIYIAKEGAVLHDYGYRTPGYISKALIAKVFLEAMKVTGIPWWRRQILYWAVRLFGSSSYKGGVK